LVRCKEGQCATVALVNVPRAKFTNWKLASFARNDLGALEKQLNEKRSPVRASMGGGSQSREVPKPDNGGPTFAGKRIEVHRFLTPMPRQDA
jgi:hypothetical protein